MMYAWMFKNTISAFIKWPPRGKVWSDRKQDLPIHSLIDIFCKQNNQDRLKYFHKYFYQQADNFCMMEWRGHGDIVMNRRPEIKHMTEKKLLLKCTVLALHYELPSFTGSSDHSLYQKNSYKPWFLDFMAVWYLRWYYSLYI